MRPDWKLVLVGDAVYDAGTEKWAADAYGQDMTTVHVGPYNLDLPSGWTVTRVPDTNTVGARLIASRVP